MKQLVSFPMEDGNQVIVEVEETETRGTTRVSNNGKFIQAQQTIEDALQKVLPMTKSVIKKLQSIDAKPQEIEVTFGIKLNASVGAVIASASSEANFDITLRWSREDVNH